MNIISYTTQSGIGFAKKNMYCVYAAIIAALVNIIGNYILIPYMGAEGAAITTCISFTLYFWLLTLFSRRLWYKFGLWKYVLDIALMAGFSVMVYFKVPLVLEILMFTGICFVNGTIMLPYVKVYLNKRRDGRCQK